MSRFKDVDSTIDIIVNQISNNKIIVDECFVVVDGVKLNFPVDNQRLNDQIHTKVDELIANKLSIKSFDISFTLHEKPTHFRAFLQFAKAPFSLWKSFKNLFETRR
jgi:hypothetical protein